MEPKRKSDTGKSDGQASGSSPILLLLRQYLGGLIGKGTATKSGRKPHVGRGGVHVKQMNVKMNKGVRKTGKNAFSRKIDVSKIADGEKIFTTPEENIGSQIERSLQEYIARRSAMLSRPGEVKSEKNPKIITRTIVVRAPTAPALPADASPSSQETQGTTVPGGEMSEKVTGRLMSADKEKPESKVVLVPSDELIPTAKAPKVGAPSEKEESSGGGLAGLFDGFSFFSKKEKNGAHNKGRIIGHTTDVEEKEEARKIAESLYATEQKVKSRQAASTPIPEPIAEPQARTGGGLLRFLPFFSKAVLETAKRTDVLEGDLAKAKGDAKQMSERLSQAEKKLSAVPAKQTAADTNASKATKAADAVIGQFAATAKKEEPAAKEVPVDRKKSLENEEKRAEVMMMRAAKKITPKKAGFFKQIASSLEYMGLGKQRLLIIQNLGTMLGAGLPLIDALHTLQLESKNRPMKKLLNRIITGVDNGSPLWRAMEEQSFFSPHAIALIRIGEEAGNLAENMRYLAEQQEKDEALTEKVKMAMIYPSIVLVLMFIIVMGLGLFVLPQLIGVLKNLNAHLPLVTILLIDFTDAFTKYAYIAIPALLISVVALVILAKFTRFKIVTQWVTFKIPGVGRLARDATLARFGVILGGLLQAGVPLVEALHSLVDVTPTVAYKNFYKKLLDHVNAGDSFARSFTVIRSTNRILPLSMQQLIITGEKTGTLAEIMLKISSIYEREANNTAQKLPVILEPMILLGIGALVGTIAFAIIIPIYSIVGNVGGNGQ